MIGNKNTMLNKQRDFHTGTATFELNSITSDMEQVSMTQVHKHNYENASR